MRFVAVLVLALSAAPAFAQQAPLDKVYACSGEKDDAKRLACYDAAVGALKQAQGAGGVVVVERAQIDRAEKEAFGLATPSLTALAQSAAASSASAATSATASASAAAKPAAPASLDRVTVTVKSVEKRQDGTYRFVMENGQIWVQSDGQKMGNIGKGPWTAEIKKAAMGTFMLKLDGRTAVRAKRLE